MRLSQSQYSLTWLTIVLFLFKFMCLLFIGWTWFSAGFTL
ncbi:hypothetical protein SLEP1_g4933 [Rubroshorea leprosula]|uniref:ATP synthase F0 subunit 8 n=1 Tax=Rubroshorea leprosula TaxID=152421 RepID=A0AAV5HWP2_9ROSI|nr:hypothetical protein SLEP1_g4933 [Rubroshorea leprosula]